MVIKSNKLQIENEAEGDKTEESENSGKAVTNMFKVACKVQIWKKTFCQNSDKLGYSFIKNDIMFMYLLCIYK